MSDKMRIDLYLAQNGYVKSRKKASELISSGNVTVNGRCITKASFIVDDSCVIEVNSSDDMFVSRGGLKLLKAIDEFSIDLKDLVCIDIGASTGGFTDCMLSKGAKKVYAVDVGHGQLDKSLCEDNRVVNMEGTNVRYLTPDDFDEEIDFISVDVSFISLKLVLPVIKELLKDKKYAVCLVKPQFEAGKENIGKNGVVKDKKIHIMVLKSVYEAVKQNNLSLYGVSFSPIKGPQGNIEYLFYINNEADSSIIKEEKLYSVAEESHLFLDKKEV